MERMYPLGTVLGVSLVALIVGLTVGAAFLSDFDTKDPAFDIAGWDILHNDIAFNSMNGEDRIEVLISYVAEGADPRPAWPVFSEMMNGAFADIYARGRTECIEDCEITLEQIRNVYLMMDEQH